MNYKDLPKPFLALAPMDDVTDTVFRQIVASCAPADLYFTEFVSVDGLQSPGRKNLLRKLRFVPEETRLVAQIWGLEPENFRKTARQIVDGTFARELGLPAGSNFIGVDLNMGCPAKSEVQNGACSALIKNRPLATDIIEATKDGLAGKLPLSVKTRTGFNEVDMSWIEFLLEHKLNMLSLHGRTKKQMSKVPADWELIGQAREIRDKMGVSTLVVGNGDVMNSRQANELAAKYKLDGIMIGRGIFQDPFAFADDSPWPDLEKHQKIDLYRKHVELFVQTWGKDKRPVAPLNKFCKIYINGFDGAKEIRHELMQCSTPDELLGKIKKML